MNTKGLAWRGAALVLLVIAMILAAWWFYRQAPLNAFGDWIADIVILLVFVFVVGDAITGRWSGLLIDSRNKMSLSRFQLLLWTLIIAPGILAIAVARIFHGDSDPLKIVIPQEVWLLLGISTVSLVGTPIIQAYKASQTPSNTQSAKFDMLKEAPTATNVPTPLGLLAVNTTEDQAEWTDLFRGEEVSNFAYMDLGKIQMFFFTLVIAGAYAAALGAALWEHHEATEFPNISQSMLAFLGLSHGTYLTNKAAPHG